MQLTPNLLLAFFIFFIGVIGCILNLKNFFRFYLSAWTAALASIIIFLLGDVEFFSTKGMIFSLFIIIIVAVEFSIGLILYSKDGQEN